MSSYRRGTWGSERGHSPPRLPQSQPATTTCVRPMPLHLTFLSTDGETEARERRQPTPVSLPDLQQTRVVTQLLPRGCQQTQGFKPTLASGREKEAEFQGGLGGSDRAPTCTV